MKNAGLFAILIFRKKLFRKKYLIFISRFVVKIYNKALKCEEKYGVPAAIITAQACIESGYGKDVIIDKYTGENSYNYFGIKAKSNQAYVVADTYEVINGKRDFVKDEHFAKYKNINAGLKAHSKLLKRLYKAPKNTIKSWANSLQTKGYATAPGYAKTILDVIDYWNLK